MDRPLMPKATAVWLVENTSLTFEQIADFCNLHPLEVKGIADGEVGAGIRGLDPVASPGVLVAGHAPFTWGPEAKTSVKNAVALEAVAQMAIGTFLINEELPILEHYVLNKHYQRKHGPEAYYGQAKR